jgi:hypothetical protein
MLPRLQAEEAMQAATRVSAGTGTLTTDAARRVWRAWELAADRASRAPAPPHAGAAAAAGIGIRRVAKKVH